MRILHHYCLCDKIGLEKFLKKNKIIYHCLSIEAMVPTISQRIISCTKCEKESYEEHKCPHMSVGFEKRLF